MHIFEGSAVDAVDRFLDKVAYSVKVIYTPDWRRLSVSAFRTSQDELVEYLAYGAGLPSDAARAVASCARYTTRP